VAWSYNILLLKLPTAPEWKEKKLLQRDFKTLEENNKRARVSAE
jgi:hypothetical protein